MVRMKTIVCSKDDFQLVMVRMKSIVCSKDDFHGQNYCSKDDFQLVMVRMKTIVIFMVRTIALRMIFNWSWSE